MTPPEDQQLGLSDVYSRGTKIPGTPGPALPRAMGMDINSKKEPKASDQFALLLRDQWADYVNRFQPYDAQLREIALGDADNIQAENIARDSAERGFGLADASFGRQQSRYGISNTAEEQGILDKQSELAKTAARVGAVNGARLHAADRDKKLMTGDLAVGLRDLEQ